MGDLLPDADCRRHAAGRGEHPGRAVGRIRGQQAIARPGSLSEGRSGLRRPVRRRGARSVEDRHRRDLHGAVVFQPHAALSQQEDAQGSRRRSAADQLCRTDGRCGQDEGRGQDRLPHHQFRLAVLAALQDERRRRPQRRHDQGCVQHAGRSGDADQARRSDQERSDQQHFLDRSLGRTQYRLRVRQCRHVHGAQFRIVLGGEQGRLDQ